jgi:hypothetical protein
MRTSRVLTFFVLTIVSGAALALSSPPSVTGVRAVLQDGRVLVRWDALPTEHAIAYYRVYFSRESILDAGGVYDDFVATEGPRTEISIDPPPQTRTLTVAVMAVNSQGLESEFFVEEALVQIIPPTDTEPALTEAERAPPGTNAQDRDEGLRVAYPTGDRPTAEEYLERTTQIQEQQTSLPAWESLDTGGTLHLILTETVSPRSLLLTFSAPPTVEPDRAPEAVGIVDEQGQSLWIESIVLEGETMAINTAPQTPERVYEVRLSDPLRGTNGAPLDPTNRRAFFQGFGTRTGGTPVTAPTSTAQPSALGPVRNLRLRSQADGGGTYAVEALWEVDLGPTMIGYAVRQSLDGGRTFSEAQMLSRDVGGIRVPGVQPGMYGLAIRTIDASGNLSMETFSSVTLPGGQSAPQPTSVAETRPPVSVQRPVVDQPSWPVSPLILPPHLQREQPSIPLPTPERRRPLAQTGAGLLTALAATAGIAGWKRTRLRWIP